MVEQSSSPEEQSGSHVRELRKVLHPRDGFALAMVSSAAAFGALGYSMGSLGAWGAACLWGVSVVIGVVSTRIYAEMATMFPDTPGGFSLYANQGWKRYSTFVGPIATFGYWFGWSVALAVIGVTIGGVVQEQWFPHATWSFYDGVQHVGLTQLIAAAVIVLVWILNVFGVKTLVRSAYLLGALLVVPIVIFIVGPFVSGTWHSSNLHWTVPSGGSGLKLALVWLYIMGWSTYGTEICATIAPEFRRTERDTWTALKWAGVWTLAVYLLLPITIGGVASPAEITANPIGFYGLVFNQIMGGGAWIGIAFLVAALVLVMNSSTADGSRALYGMARDGLTVKQLHHLNKHHVPGRAMTVDLVVNLLLVFFVANPIAILLAGNLGFFVAVFFALTGYILLRRDRPDWPRPIRLRPIWVIVAGVLAAFTVVVTVLAALNPSITGYGSSTDLAIGVGILALGVVFYIVRTVVQDERTVEFRDLRPNVPAPQLQTDLHNVTPAAGSSPPRVS